MDLKFYITSSTALFKGKVFKNGKGVLKNRGADLSAFLLSVYQHVGITYPKFYKMDNLSKLGWLTTEVLLDGSDIKSYKPEEVGLILCNANASLDSDKRYNDSIHDIPSPALFVYTLPNIMIGEICIRNNFKGEDAFFIFDKFDAAFISSYVSGLLSNNVLQVCICGWVDVLAEDYKAVLFLVEKAQQANAIQFTEDNLNNIFNNLTA